MESSLIHEEKIHETKAISEDYICLNHITLSPKENGAPYNINLIEPTSEENLASSERLLSIPESANAVKDMSLLAKKEAKSMGHEFYREWKILKKTKRLSSQDSEKFSKQKRHRHKSHDSKNDMNDEILNISQETTLPNHPDQSEDYFGTTVNFEKPDYSTAVDPFEVDVEKTSPDRFKKHTNHGKGGATSSVAQKARQDALYREEAIKLVQSMHQARIMDEKIRKKQNQPPVSRLGLIKTVELASLRSYLHEELLENGFLKELAYWFYDVRRNELAPLDLRCTALDALRRFRILGEKLPEQSGSHGRRREEDLDSEIISERGVICRKYLEKTLLGFAVNNLRLDKNELTENKAKACEILERLSRAFTEDKVDGGLGKGRISTSKLWNSQNPSGVQSPFFYVETATEAFQRRITQPDPSDPISFFRAPPLKLRPSIIQRTDSP